MAISTPRRSVELTLIAHQAADDGFRALVEEGAPRGLIPACRPGCAACCTYVAQIVGSEAVLLAQVVERMPSDDRRVTVDRLFAWVDAWAAHAPMDPDGELLYTALSWQIQRVACPLLDPLTRTCTVYASRPIACRTHHACPALPSDEPACWQCGHPEPGAGCFTSLANVSTANGHRPHHARVWQLRTDLIDYYGHGLAANLVNDGAVDVDEIMPGVLAPLVLEHGRRLFGWARSRVVALTVLS